MVKEDTGKQITVVCQMLLLPETEVKQGKGHRETHGEGLSGNLTGRREGALCKCGEELFRQRV